MSTIKTFEELDAWKVSRELCNKVGLLIDSGCFKNNFRLIGQVEGSSGSIMDNIAEGFERDGRLELRQFLSIAKGSAGEARSQLYRALDRGHLAQEEFESLNREVVDIIKMLHGFMEYLNSQDMRGRKYRTPDGK